MTVSHCDLCGKGKLVTRMGKHHKGVAGGKWKHRAPKTVRVLKPNLHPFKGILLGRKGKWWLCTKCLRKIKSKAVSGKEKPGKASSKVSP